MRRTACSRQSAWGWRAIACTAAVLLIAGCGDKNPTGSTLADPNMKSMSFDPGALTITVGSTDYLQLTDQDGSPLLTPNTVTVTTDHENVVRVVRGYDDERGFYAVVVGIIPGAATITAESGGVTATATISVVADAPPSNRLAFVRGDAIFLSDFAGAEPVLLVRLADLGEGAHDFALSRDGSRIAFVPAYGREVCIARLDGSDRRCTSSEISDSYGNLSGPVWSPDGRELLFSGEPKHWGGEELGYVYEPRMFLFSLATETMTTKPLVARFEGSYAIGASWAPDGSSIAFAMNGVVWTVNRDGSNLHVSARPADNVNRVVWSRNGRLAVVIWGWDGGCPWLCNTAIGISDTDGTGFRVFATARAAKDAFLDSGFSGGPAWSSNAKLLAYDYQDCSAGWDPCRSDVFIVRTDNGEKSLLFEDAELIRWRP